MLLFNRAGRDRCRYRAKRFRDASRKIFADIMTCLTMETHGTSVPGDISDSIA
jgi:hypothetical protein